MSRKNPSTYRPKKLGAAQCRGAVWRPVALAAAAVGLLAGACTSHVRVVHVTDQEIEDGGVYYALPQTEVLTELTIEQTTKKPGKYPKWATPLFDVADVIEKPVPTLTVKPNPKITTRGVPDPEHVYLVKARGDWYEKRAVELGLDPWGTVEKLDHSVTDSRADVLAAVAKTVLSWGALPSYPKVKVLEGTEVTAQFFEEKGVFGFEGQEGCPNLPIELAKLLRLVDRDVQSEVLGLFGRNPSELCKVYTERPGDLPGVVGALVSIFELRVLRDKLLTGQLGANGSSSDLVATIDKLEERIDRLLGKWFVGFEDKTSWTGTIPTLPDDRRRTDWPLLVVDPEKGVCEAENGLSLVSLGVPEELRSDECAEHPVVLRLELAEDYVVGKVAKAAGGYDTNKGHGFVYRVPGRLDATLEWKHDCDSDPKQLFGDVVLIAQYGPVVPLPTTTGGRTSGYKIALHPETGALKSFALSSDPAVTAANVTTVGDALVAREKAEREQDDQLARLKREKEILEAMQKIEELREELGTVEQDP